MDQVIGKKRNINNLIVLKKISYINRINALACIMSAKHGWIGATFSCAEILTYLYFNEMNFIINNIGEISGDVLILSKGHAAPMQYACLAGLGVIDFEDLKTYKTRTGLQAHTDKKTPGIISNTGSLGQSLSKACGIALVSRQAGKKQRVYVVLGDGELQEGQNYEALMSIRQLGLTEVIPIIDRNRLQTDSNTEDIKKLPELQSLFRSFGFEMADIDGHDISNISRAFSRKVPSANRVIVANTIKGYGSEITSMRGSVSRRNGVWHSRVPSKEEYILILRELVKKIDDDSIKKAFDEFVAESGNGRESILISTDEQESTRDLFSKKLFSLARNNKKIIILDADLEKSMKLTDFALKYPDRFVECGISEQDMVSIAGGIALKGYVPVVNTYASFLRRAYEQIYINATEETFIIYAGHYSGLCYTTDGKSHQMTGDISMMRAIPGMRVYDPFCKEELEGILDYYLNETASIRKKSFPVYIKLRRKGTDYPVYLGKNYKFSISRGTEIIRGKDVCLVSSGPHITSFCLQAVSKQAKSQAGVIAFSSQNFLDEKHTLLQFAKYKKLIILEEGIVAGGLSDEISKIVCRSGLPIKIVRKGVKGFTFSSREKSDLFKYFGLDTNGIGKILKNGI